MPHPVAPLSLISSKSSYSTRSHLLSSPVSFVSGGLQLYGPMSRLRFYSRPFGQLATCCTTSVTWMILPSMNQYRPSRGPVACVMAHATASGHVLPTAATTLAASAVACAFSSRLVRIESVSGVHPAATSAPTPSISTLAPPTTTSSTSTANISNARNSNSNTISSATTTATTTSTTIASATTNRNSVATSAAVTAQPSSSSSSPPLEGTPIPWARLGPSLGLIQQSFRVGGATFRLIAPGDVDAVMDMYLEQNQLDADPYWTRAWPAAIALAAILLQRPELVAGKVVADLGAGLGLAGMAAALAGAKEVVLLDREPAALQCALLSAAATGLDLDLNSDGADLLDPESLGRPTAATNTAAATPTATATVIATTTANSEDGRMQKRSRRKVEPLPADQLPPYAALQFTPPYRHLGGKAGNRQQRDQQGREREWQVLMALARSLGRATAAVVPPPPPPPPPHVSGTREVPEGELGCSAVRDGSSSGAGATAVPATSARESEPASSTDSPNRQISSYSLTSSSPASLSQAVAAVSADEPACSSSSRGSMTGTSCGEDGGSGSEISSVLRAHVFDWTAPPEMDRLLPPASMSASSQQQQQQPQPRGRGRPGAVRQRRFDVVLACDVLYEDAAVGPISGLMPLLLRPDGGRLLLADPPNRTVRNRERFLQEIRSGPLRLSVEECSLQQCEVSQLDNEMAGGLAPSVETVPVQFLVFRSGLGNDTVGLKL